MMFAALRPQPLVRRRDSRHTIALGTSWRLGPLVAVRMRYPEPGVDEYSLDFDQDDDASYPVRRWSFSLRLRRGWRLDLSQDRNTDAR